MTPAVHRSHAGPLVDRVNASHRSVVLRRAAFRRAALCLALLSVVLLSAVHCVPEADEHGHPIPAGIRR